MRYTRVRMRGEFSPCAKMDFHQQGGDLPCHIPANRNRGALWADSADSARFRFRPTRCVAIVGVFSACLRRWYGVNRRRRQGINGGGCGCGCGSSGGVHISLGRVSITTRLGRVTAFRFPLSVPRIASFDNAEGRVLSLGSATCIL